MLELFLSLSALCAFSLLPAGAPVMLRCGLSACLRFSPRAALALSSIAALSACTAMLLCRGGLLAASPAQRGPAVLAGFLGGTAGRMLLLIFTARFSGSLALARIQALPLILLSGICFLPCRLSLPGSPAGLFVFGLLCAITDGFFGCGGTALFLLFSKGGVTRKNVSPSGAALLCSTASQSGALSLTLLSGEAQIFPVRMLITLAAASLWGGLVFEKTKKRSPLTRKLRTALCVYMLLAALSCAAQVYLY